MKFLLDENSEFRIAEFLREQGHDVTAIAYDHPNALPDEEILAIAYREGRILITNDRDFGELIFRQHFRHAGVIYFRMPAATAMLKIDRLATILTDHTADLRHFLTVRPRSIRVRRGGDETSPTNAR